MKGVDQWKGGWNVNLLFRCLLAVSVTSWMFVIYGIKEGITAWNIPQCLFGTVLFCVPVVLSYISIGITSFLKAESLGGCQKISLADNDFLPAYLGYFFVSLSIPDITTMIYLHVFVFGFVFFSQTQYFNPIFLLFGYHYYQITTECGTSVFIIKRGKVIRNKAYLSFDNLKRINDTTYIQRKEK
ncbi:hypothetical protein ACPW7J_03250 [Ihubacter sp. rT4E-8]|uniref:hypothetical protein n=1 Tax=Ihubacter sp. rT4E-8 TaxID=3242369 RepID=UPI003CEB2ECF